jgi:hypothetical protein
MDDTIGRAQEEDESISLHIPWQHHHCVPIITPDDDILKAEMHVLPGSSSSMVLGRDHVSEQGMTGFMLVASSALIIPRSTNRIW